MIHKTDFDNSLSIGDDMLNEISDSIKNFENFSTLYCIVLKFIYIFAPENTSQGIIPSLSGLPEEQKTNAK